MEIKHCEYCGSVISERLPCGEKRRAKNVRFCSRKCLHASQRRKLDLCQVCGKDIPRRLRNGGSRRQCCSHWCHRIARGSRVQKCPTCGIEFLVARSAKRIFCNRKCQRGSGIPNAICNHCGKAFHAKIYSDGRRFAKRFCNRKCQIAYSHIKMKCAFCGYPVTRSHGRVGSVAFCSVKCSSSWQKQNHGKPVDGPTNLSKWRWNWKVKAHDGNRCRICYDDGKGSRGPLIAHHIRGKTRYPKLKRKLENGITFCTKCHDGKHHPKRMDLQTFGASNYGQRLADDHLLMLAWIREGKLTFEPEVL